MRLSVQPCLLDLLSIIALGEREEKQLDHLLITLDISHCEQNVTQEKNQHLLTIKGWVYRTPCLAGRFLGKLYQLYINLKQQQHYIAWLLKLITNHTSPLFLFIEFGSF